jgi:hypothetical protein
MVKDDRMTTSPITSPTHSHVESLVREQARLLLDLTALAERQRDAVAGKDADTLDLILEQRQRLIDRLSQVADNLTTRSEDVLRLSAGANNAVARDLAEATRLWSALASRDAEDLSDLRRQRDALAAELASIARTSRANASYTSQRPEGALFQDTQA